MDILTLIFGLLFSAAWIYLGLFILHVHFSPKKDELAPHSEWVGMAFLMTGLWLFTWIAIEFHTG